MAADAPQLLTTKQVADILELTVQRVNRIAKDRGIGQASPWGYRLFTEADVATMSVRNPIGRPKTAATND